jgi:chemotaxis protein CheD
MMPILVRPAVMPPSQALELMPGDVAHGTAGDTFKTLLGSCVSVVLTEPTRRYASLSHIVHVGMPNASNRHNTAFGVAAMHILLAQMRARGIPPKGCEAYVYGGGNMFPQLFRGQHVGVANSEWVLQYLDHHGVSVLKQDVGGSGYRKLTWTVGPDAPAVDTISAV